MSVLHAVSGVRFRAPLARFLIALSVAIGIATDATACATCPACRLAQACGGPTPPGGYEVGQALTSLSGGGGAADPIQPGSWTMAIMPDTQVYAMNNNGVEFPHFTNQTQWLADNLVSHNIKMVLHEGDITNNNNVPQWDNVKTAFNILDAGNVPYALAPGNHDYGPNGNSANRTTLFHNAEYFGPASAYANQPTVGGFFEAGKTDNAWHTFSAGGNDWIVFTMEFGPRNEVIAWANDVLEDHSDKLAILVTHAYMYYDDTIYDWATYGNAQNWNPHAYGVANQPGQTVNDGQELWDKFVKLHENFRFVFNGHVLSDGTGYRATLGDHGNVVHQMLANYQMNVEGGAGDMRLLEFLDDGETVNVRTYSPSLDRYNRSPDQNFTVKLNELPPAPTTLYHAVGANIVVGGPTAPAGNTVDSVVVAQSGTPGVGYGEINKGDYEVSVRGRGLAYAEGILLASVTQHSRPDHPQPATVEAGRNSFSYGNMALSVMRAGFSGDTEVNFNTSVAWFAFEGGWTGAHVNANGTLATGLSNYQMVNAYNNVTQSQVNKTGTGRYTVNMGANAQNDGMLFVIGNNNNDFVVQTGLLPGGTTWDIRTQDSGSNFSATGEDGDWSFLYMPYDTPNLIGGYYDGIANTHINSAGSFTMNRLSTGQYELTVPGEAPTTGMLVLSVANQVTIGPNTGPDDNILVYQPGAGNKFLINSYDLTNSGVALENTKFAWAFIAFEDPVTQVAPPPGIDLDATIDRTTNRLTLVNNGKEAADIKAISILSGNGALVPANWRSISTYYDEAPGDGTVDSDDPWTVLSSTVFNLSEREQSGGNGGTIGIGETIDFGDIWKRSRIEDIMLQVEYTNGGTEMINLLYTGGPDEKPYHPSDLNTDGFITVADWNLFYPNMLANLSSMTGVQRALAGDIDGDGDNDVNDFALFKSAFEAANGAGSFDNILNGVPEPSTYVLLLVAGAFAYAARSRLRSSWFRQ